MTGDTAGELGRESKWRTVLRFVLGFSVDKNKVYGTFHDMLFLHELNRRRNTLGFNIRLLIPVTSYVEDYYPREQIEIYHVSPCCNQNQGKGTALKRKKGKLRKEQSIC